MSANPFSSAIFRLRRLNCLLRVPAELSGPDARQALMRLRAVGRSIAEAMAEFDGLPADRFRWTIPHELSESNLRRTLYSAINDLDAYHQRALRFADRISDVIGQDVLRPKPFCRQKVLMRVPQDLRRGEFRFLWQKAKQQAERICCVLELVGHHLQDFGPMPPEPTLGACCSTNLICYDGLEFSECSGTWYPAQTCNSVPCGVELKGACCLTETGACIENTTYTQCTEELQGIWQGAGSDCVPGFLDPTDPNDPCTTPFVPVPPPPIPPGGTCGIGGLVSYNICTSGYTSSPLGAYEIWSFSSLRDFAQEQCQAGHPPPFFWIFTHCYGYGAVEDPGSYSWIVQDAEDGSWVTAMSGEIGLGWPVQMCALCTRTNTRWSSDSYFQPSCSQVLHSWRVTPPGTYPGLPWAPNCPRPGCPFFVNFSCICMSAYESGPVLSPDLPPAFLPLAVHVRNEGWFQLSSPAPPCPGICGATGSPGAPIVAGCFSTARGTGTYSTTLFRLDPAWGDIAQIKFWGFTTGAGQDVRIGVHRYGALPDTLLSTQFGPASNCPPGGVPPMVRYQYVPSTEACCGPVELVEAPEDPPTEFLGAIVPASGATFPAATASAAGTLYPNPVILRAFPLFDTWTDGDILIVCTLVMIIINSVEVVQA